MQSNVCIFTKIVHVASGKEIDPGLLQEGTYIEALSLDSPKLMLVLRDHGSYLQNQLRLQEFDELSVSLGDTWREDGVSSQETFVVLTSRPMPDGTVRLNCLAKPVFDMKKIADRTRVFNQRGVQEIAAAFAGGLKRSIGQFAVVENYHCIAGERPTTMLRQLAQEVCGAPCPGSGYDLPLRYHGFWLPDSQVHQAIYPDAPSGERDPVIHWLE